MSAFLRGHYANPIPTHNTRPIHRSLRHLRPVVVVCSDGVHRRLSRPVRISLFDIHQNDALTTVLEVE